VEGEDIVFNGGSVEKRRVQTIPTRWEGRLGFAGSEMIIGGDTRDCVANVEPGSKQRELKMRHPTLIRELASGKRKRISQVAPTATYKRRRPSNEGVLPFRWNREAKLIPDHWPIEEDLVILIP